MMVELMVYLWVRLSVRKWAVVQLGAALVRHSAPQSLAVLSVAEMALMWVVTIVPLPLEPPWERCLDS
jgi:hypothetical protein